MAQQVGGTLGLTPQFTEHALSDEVFEWRNKCLPHPSEALWCGCGYPLYPTAWRQPFKSPINLLYSLWSAFPPLPWFVDLQVDAPLVLCPKAQVVLLHPYGSFITLINNVLFLSLSWLISLIPSFCKENDIEYLESWAALEYISERDCQVPVEGAYASEWKDHWKALNVDSEDQG